MWKSLSSKRKKQSGKKTGFVPSLMVLEDRITPVNDFWRPTEVNNLLWSTAGNWSLQQPPRANDVAVFDRNSRIGDNSANCTVDSGVTVTTIDGIETTPGYGGTITLNQGLTFTGPDESNLIGTTAVNPRPATVQTAAGVPNCTLNFNGTDLYIGRAATINNVNLTFGARERVRITSPQPITFTSDQIYNSGTILLPEESRIRINANDPPLEINTTITLNSGSTIFNGGQINIRPENGITATVNNTVGTTGGIVNLLGTITQIGAGTGAINVPITNFGGTIQVNAGTLNALAGITQYAGATTLAGGTLIGNVSLGAGTLSGVGTIVGSVSTFGLPLVGASYATIHPGPAGQPGNLTMTALDMAAGGTISIGKQRCQDPFFGSGKRVLTPLFCLRNLLPLSLPDTTSL